MTDLLRDARLACRTLRHQPGFAAAVAYAVVLGGLGVRLGHMDPMEALRHE